MADEYKQSITRVDFLQDRKADQVFAKIDYLLRSGVHIQRDHPLPGELFRFIERNFESLSLYYQELFMVRLGEGGNEFNNYYYLDFEEGRRGLIPEDSREYLRTEHILIGLLFFKVFKLDGNIELDKVSDFTSLLFSEYEEEKNALRRLIADAMTDKSSDLTDERIGSIISKAFSKFNDLGWIAWESDQEKDRFRYMPSFERLRLLYQPQILGVDELIRSLRDDQ